MIKEVEVHLHKFSGSCYSCQKLQNVFPYVQNYQFKFCSIICFLKQQPNYYLKELWFCFFDRLPPKTRTEVIYQLSKKMEGLGW